MRQYLLFFFGLFILSCQSTEKTESDNDGLGSINFPNTGSEVAQKEFYRGVLALHSFFYPEAEEAFQLAREMDPDFVMAYWGEAMSNNKTFWQIQDKDNALEILNLLGDNPEEWAERTQDPVEKKYLESLGILYSEEPDKLIRDKEYMNYMKAFNQEFPDNHEVKAFYVLSLLGILRDNQGNEKIRMEAGALCQEILDENPDHPGALHYLIHSMDDPLHARIALKAADRYSVVAPEAHHARHMPSHIYVQLGMWNKVISSNISAWDASRKWADSKNLGVTSYDDHSLAWMTYGYEQTGQFEKAFENLRIIQENNRDTATGFSKRYELSMLCRLWAEASNTDSLELKLTFEDVKRGGRISWQFVNGWDAIRKKDESGYQSSIQAFDELEEEYGLEERSFMISLVQEHRHALEGLKAYSEGNIEGFHLSFTKGIQVEESLNAPTGPPDMVKPIHELYGELLLELGDYEGALDNFSIQLQRTPNRSPSQLGMARAYLGLGDLEKSKEHYQAFALNYSNAKNHPYYDEAKRFLIANPDSLMAMKSVSFNYIEPQVYYDKRMRITDCPVPVN